MAGKKWTSSEYRFLTQNFIGDKITKFSDQSGISSWKMDNLKNEGDKIEYDTKNCIYCANPTYNWSCYYNYLTYLNQTYDYWHNYGLLDQRFKPLIYMPSFWSDTTISDQLMQMATVAGANVQRTRGTSFMYESRTVGMAEYWIYKDDLAKLMNFVKDRFKEMFGVEAKGRFDLGDLNPDKVKTTQLIKVFMEMERCAEGA
jgi:hypothetical protein